MEQSVAWKRYQIKRLRRILDNNERLKEVCRNYGHEEENYRGYLKDQIAMTEWEIADLEGSAGRPCGQKGER